MEPEHGRGITENTIQSRHDNPFVTLPNKADINSELLHISHTPSDGNAPPVVSNETETGPSAASYGSPYGTISVDDPSVAPFPIPEGHVVQSVTPESVLAPNVSAQASGWSMTSASPSSGPGYLIHDSMLTEDVDWRNPNQSSVSCAMSQSMVHGDGYDPNRIPSSVFTTTPANPMDWSLASNESLFSIYMGNSFSGYQGIFKSGELGTIGGLNPQNPFETFDAKANEGKNFSPDLPTLPESYQEHERQQSENIEDDTKIEEEPSTTATTDECKETNVNKASHEENIDASTISAHKGRVNPFEIANSIENHLSNESSSSPSAHKLGPNPFERTNSIQDRLSNKSAKGCSSNNRLSTESAKSNGSVNRLSNASEISCGSFAFPVLVNEVNEIDKCNSFRMRADKKEQPQIKQKPEEPKTVTRAATRGRGCLSCLPLWLRCW
ncbi:hypothetical protein LIER_35268 [Lithospermum erythrorhizon]|uniref:Uncharacterized protein n=1 Tax=Lithospermum erythrorhizon TaxID=34254 RepID=A0AAV3NN77_LITER